MSTREGVLAPLSIDCAAISTREHERILPVPTDPLWDQLPAAPLSVPIPVLHVSVDGTGVPMLPEALAGRVGKQPDGSAKTREINLGCVFTQHATDTEGRALFGYSRSGIRRYRSVLCLEAVFAAKLLDRRLDPDVPPRERVSVTQSNRAQTQILPVSALDSV